MRIGGTVLGFIVAVPLSQGVTPLERRAAPPT
jgi:hypothetical protein